MRKRIEINIGDIYNRLTVRNHLCSNVYECECQCGNICSATASQLKYQRKKSCGCQKIDSAKALCISRATHRLSKTKEYKALSNKRYRDTHSVAIKARKREYHQKCKTTVFTHYCNGEIECKKCGEKDTRCLNLDHVNGGGRRHQRQTSGIYRDIIRRNFPGGFQILCQSCNWIKMYENEEVKSNGRNNPSLKSINKLRLELISVYSSGKNNCAKCEVSDIRVLCLDHIEGNGASDRHKHGGTLGWWRSLRKQSYPSGIQVLCQNCNRRKMYENNEFNRRV